MALVITPDWGKSHDQAAIAQVGGCLRTQSSSIGLFLLTCPAQVSAVSSMGWMCHHSLRGEAGHWEVASMAALWAEGGSADGERKHPGPRSSGECRAALTSDLPACNSTRASHHLIPRPQACPTQSVYQRYEQRGGVCKRVCPHRPGSFPQIGGLSRRQCLRRTFHSRVLPTHPT